MGEASGGMVGQLQRSGTTERNGCALKAVDMSREILENYAINSVLLLANNHVIFLLVRFGSV